MGTSSSSKGPGSRIPLDPPWLKDLTSQISKENSENVISGSKDGKNIVEVLSEPQRFRGTRLNLKTYLNTGNKDYLKSSLKHYVSKGMGGSGKLTSRMGYSVAAISNLIAALSNPQEFKIDTILKNLNDGNITLEDACNNIVEKIIGSGGSLDENSCKDSMLEALLNAFDESDDVSLPQEDKLWDVLARFLSAEIFSRIMIDAAQIFERCSDASKAIELENDMKEYILILTRSIAKDVRSQGLDLYAKNFSLTVNRILKEVLTIFENYED